MRLPLLDRLLLPLERLDDLLRLIALLDELRPLLELDLDLDDLDLDFWVAMGPP